MKFPDVADREDAWVAEILASESKGAMNRALSVEYVLHNRPGARATIEALHSAARGVIQAAANIRDGVALAPPPPRVEVAPEIPAGSLVGGIVSAWEAVDRAGRRVPISAPDARSARLAALVRLETTGVVILPALPDSHPGVEVEPIPAEVSPALDTGETPPAAEVEAPPPAPTRKRRPAPETPEERDARTAEVFRIVNEKWPAPEPSPAPPAAEEVEAREPAILCPADGDASDDRWDWPDWAASADSDFEPQLIFKAPSLDYATALVELMLGADHGFCVGPYTLDDELATGQVAQWGGMQLVETSKGFGGRLAVDQPFGVLIAYDRWEFSLVEEARRDGIEEGGEVAEPEPAEASPRAVPVSPEEPTAEIAPAAEPPRVLDVGKLPKPARVDNYDVTILDPAGSGEYIHVARISIAGGIGPARLAAARLIDTARWGSPVVQKAARALAGNVAGFGGMRQVRADGVAYSIAVDSKYLRDEPTPPEPTDDGPGEAPAQEDQTAPEPTLLAAPEAAPAAPKASANAPAQAEQFDPEEVADYLTEELETVLSAESEADAGEPTIRPELIVETDPGIGRFIISDPKGKLSYWIQAPSLEFARQRAEIAAGVSKIWAFSAVRAIEPGEWATLPQSFTQTTWNHVPAEPKPDSSIDKPTASKAADDKHRHGHAGHGPALALFPETPAPADTRATEPAEGVPTWLAKWNGRELARVSGRTLDARQWAHRVWGSAVSLLPLDPQRWASYAHLPDLTTSGLDPAPATPPERLEIEPGGPYRIVVGDNGEIATRARGADADEMKRWAERVWPMRPVSHWPIGRDEWNARTDLPELTADGLKPVKGKPGRKKEEPPIGPRIVSVGGQFVARVERGEVAPQVWSTSGEIHAKVWARRVWAEGDISIFGPIPSVEAHKWAHLPELRDSGLVGGPAHQLVSAVLGGPTVAPVPAPPAEAEPVPVPPVPPVPPVAEAPPEPKAVAPLWDVYLWNMGRSDRIATVRGHNPTEARGEAMDQHFGVNVDPPKALLARLAADGSAWNVVDRQSVASLATAATTRMKKMEWDLIAEGDSGSQWIGRIEAEEAADAVSLAELRHPEMIGEMVARPSSGVYTYRVTKIPPSVVEVRNGVKCWGSWAYPPTDPATIPSDEAEDIHEEPAESPAEADPIHESAESIHPEPAKLDTDGQLLRVLSNHRWASVTIETYQKVGASVTEIRGMLGRAFAQVEMRDDKGHKGRGGVSDLAPGLSCCYMGGDSPKFWASKALPDGRPTLESAKLIERVRSLFEIPFEDMAPAPPLPKKGRKPSAATPGTGS